MKNAGPSDVQNKSAPGELEKESIPFRTPRSVTKSARRRTTSAVLALSQSSNRTPKALRTSFILRHLSPEEGYAWIYGPFTLDIIKPKIGISTDTKFLTWPYHIFTFHSISNSKIRS